MDRAKINYHTVNGELTKVQIKTMECPRRKIRPPVSHGNVQILRIMPPSLTVFPSMQGIRDFCLAC